MAEIAGDEIPISHVIVYVLLSGASVFLCVCGHEIAGVQKSVLDLKVYVVVLDFHENACHLPLWTRLTEIRRGAEW